jgi:UDP:flavonoid glycosyltransferase YjiC (YdhE family)
LLGHSFPPRRSSDLKASARQESLLDALASLGLPTVVFLNTPSPRLTKRFENSSVRIETELLSHDAITQECDLAVTNGGHLLTASMLLAGKPVVIVPQSLEQQLNGMRVRAIGAGDVASEEQSGLLAMVIERVIAAEEYRQAARAFASMYRGDTADSGLGVLVESIEKLL